MPKKTKSIIMSFLFFILGIIWVPLFSLSSSYITAFIYDVFFPNYRPELEAIGHILIVFLLFSLLFIVLLVLFLYKVKQLKQLLYFFSGLGFVITIIISMNFKNNINVYVFSKIAKLAYLDDSNIGVVVNNIDINTSKDENMLKSIDYEITLESNQDFDLKISPVIIQRFRNNDCTPSIIGDSEMNSLIKKISRGTNTISGSIDVFVSKEEVDRIPRFLDYCGPGIIQFLIVEFEFYGKQSDSRIVEYCSKNFIPSYFCQEFIKENHFNYFIKPAIAKELEDELEILNLFEIDQKNKLLYPILGTNIFMVKDVK